MRRRAALRGAALLPLVLLAPRARGEAPARVAEDEGGSCFAGRETVAFGRAMITLGIETAKYGIGVLLILLGLIVLALGYGFLLLDALFCRR
ncbi:hypothetical protein [Muricoccus radiodurans]|uniref:hypothetical protein n=1 Tax=Muricoccus radiodurans TaxID=2231721 RepID=UPI003CECA331